MKFWPGVKIHIGKNAQIDADVTIGNHFETGHHVVILEENKIGDYVSIWATR